MRIALVTTSFLPTVGGAELVVHHLAMAWSQAGHEVKVFREQGGGCLQTEEWGYSVQTYPLMRGTYRCAPHRFPFRQYNAAMLGKKLKCFSPDMVSAHFGYPVGVWLSGITSLPAFNMVTCHGKDLTDSAWGYRARYQCDQTLGRALNSFPGVIAISDYARQQMLSLGVDETRIRDIPNGVDVERFQNPVAPVIRTKFQIPDDAVLILSVGRNSGEKAYHKALDAVSRLKTDNQDIYYLIVGPGTEQLSSALSADEGVKTILSPGLFDDDLVSAYQEANLYFSASTSELFPLTVLEAMAAGLPLVLTDISGHQDMIDSGTNGFLVPVGDGQAAANRLSELIESQTLRQKMGQRNIKTARGYSWTSISEQYLDLVPGTAVD